MVRSCQCIVWVLCALLPVALAAQNLPAPAAGNHELQVPTSGNLAPHFEEANGRRIFYVDGHPFTVLAVEIPWWDLTYGRYKETETAYDYLYPAAEHIGLNALKVPVKWSLVEPQKGVYDFAYLDHAKSMAEKHHLKLVLNWFGHYASADGVLYGNLTGELYAPMYIVEDDKTYPRALDADGVAHHNTASYNYEPIIARELAAFRAFMRHIREVDAQAHTILMIQVENEIAVFGVDRRNPKLWRDHSPASNQLFAAKGFTDDLKYSAWNLSYNWIRRLTDAGTEIYPIPLFHNFVGGQIADWMVGGSPGEDVATYLENSPNTSFIGVNSYFCAEWRPDNSCARPLPASVDELREPLRRYRVGRNLPAITETNSGNNSIAARLTYIAVGEFGAPIVAPWALSESYPESYEPYVLKDGTLANGSFALREAYSSLAKALSQVSYYAGTDKLRVFMSRLPGQRFAEKAEIDGVQITVKGDKDGQAIVIHPSSREFLMVGFRCEVVLKDAVFRWPALKTLRVEKGSWDKTGWHPEGEAAYGIDQSSTTLGVDLDIPQAIRVLW